MHTSVVLSPLPPVLSVHGAVPKSHEEEVVVVKEVEADMVTSVGGTTTVPATRAVPEAEADTGLTVDTLHDTGATMAEDTSIDPLNTPKTPGPAVLVIKGSIGQVCTEERRRASHMKTIHQSLHMPVVRRGCIRTRILIDQRKT